MGTDTNPSVSEDWHPICGGLYAASNLGRIRREVGFMCRKARLLSQHAHKGCYLNVVLSIGGKRLKRHVHHLIAEAFLGPRSGWIVNHKDLNQLNNRADNLEYTTKRGNSLHAVAHGKIRGERAFGAKLTAENVKEIRSRYGAGGVTLQVLADEFGVKIVQISRIVRRECWKHI